MQGFVPVGGISVLGQDFYRATKEIHDETLWDRRGCAMCRETPTSANLEHPWSGWAGPGTTS